QAAEALANEALALFENGEIDLEELKKIYATTWEILETLKPPTEELTKAQSFQKARLLPPELAQQARSLFGSTSSETANLMKQIIHDNLGVEAEKALEEILAELPKDSLSKVTNEPIPEPALRTPPSLANRGMRILNVLLDGTFGANINDLTSPRAFSY